MTAISPLQVSPPLRQWTRASWQEYIALRDAPVQERMKLAFDCGWMWVEMGGEGINHAAVCDLFTMLLTFWAIQHPEETFTSLGRCLLEKPETQAAAPDLVLYRGAEYPRWEPGRPRWVDLDRTRVPDLVGEVSDTTLASDLDEQKHLYAALGIAEYWVVDVQGQRVFAFQLQANGQYQAIDTSSALAGLPVGLLAEALQRLGESTNTAVAAWFAGQIVK
ncbi:Uma2 family endonuclease [Gloeobacter kilaueensis]|uniref:Putative restriction endonuclease domain-containing protein n=1 Tax=Gloeobacter kilaueensis (strain ATCC BAA-2537 / CCAP 1431/1 / ULC 316 / JS1) TaxID=1183438 RepID=U5QD26_GLOK1|nr:Uma2 family endonuclease [Gloeobacter kilaueensis]AGY56758.1 hypothetical protein GKIL_0512 [Gloeobacter kilaueensis JS1]